MLIAKIKESRLLIKNIVTLQDSKIWFDGWPVEKAIWNLSILHSAYYVSPSSRRKKFILCRYSAANNTFRALPILTHFRGLHCKFISNVILDWLLLGILMQILLIKILMSLLPQVTINLVTCGLHERHSIIVIIENLFIIDSLIIIIFILHPFAHESIHWLLIDLVTSFSFLWGEENIRAFTVNSIYWPPIFYDSFFILTVSEHLWPEHIYDRDYPKCISDTSSEEP